MKKIISYLIAVMMVFTMMPYTAFATSGNQQASEKPIGITLEPWINPDYQDVISEEDLNRDGEPLSLYSSDITYATTPEEGADVMREYMVNRVESFMLYYKFPRAKAEAVGDGTWFDETWDGIIEGTFEHTGVPVEGDYLHKHYGGLASGSITITFDENYENYLMAIPIYVTVYTDYDQEEELTAAVDSLLAEIIDDGMTDYEKIRAIYDYMTANIVYDYEHLSNNSYKLQYTAYAALVNKTSVCQGYANLFYRLALECGIDTRIITGQANGGGHAWNIVKLGSKYYLVDATWDASYAQAGYDYEYFLKPEFEDHTTDDEYLSNEFKAAYPMSETEYAICTEHTAEVIPAVDATCTETGLTEGSKCASCGKMIVKQETTPALGHDEVAHEAQAPTCIESGWEAYVTCSRCDYTTYKEIAATNHPNRQTIKGKAATCTETGLTDTEMCLDCNLMLEPQELILALGHTPGAAATCTTAQVCGVCGEELVAALGHDLIKHEAKDPTCEEDGWEEYYTCSRCDYTSFQQIGSEAHIFVQETIPATCTEGGYTQLKCIGCGKTVVTNETLPLGHSPIVVPAVPATTSKTGLTAGVKCSACDKVIVEQQIIPKIAATTLKTVTFVYSGTAKKPSVTVKDAKGKVLTLGTDFDVKYINAAGKTVAKPINVGTYRAVVTFKGNYSGSVKKTFTINPKATVLNKLIKPGKKQIKIIWQKRTAQVTGYEIQYSTTKNFTKKTTKTLKVKNFKTNVKTIKQLKAKKKYWVKIRTYKNANGKLYYSTWSKVRTIITK